MDRLSILPPGRRCDDCGEPMDPTHVYHPQLHEYVEAWKCENCDRAVIRESTSL